MTHTPWCLPGGYVHVMTGLTRHPGEVSNVIQLRLHWCRDLYPRRQPGLRVRPAVTHTPWCLPGGDVHVMAGLIRHSGEVGNVIQLRLPWWRDLYPRRQPSLRGQARSDAHTMVSARRRRTRHDGLDPPSRRSGQCHSVKGALAQGPASTTPTGTAGQVRSDAQSRVPHSPAFATRANLQARWQRAHS